MKSITIAMVKFTCIVIFTLGISFGAEAWAINSSPIKIPKSESNYPLILDKVMKDEAMFEEEGSFLEEWMFGSDFRLTEPAKEIENWMLDTEFWRIKYPSKCKDEEIDELMEIECWMTEFRVNYKNEKNIYFNIL